MNFKELHEMLPYVTGGKNHVLEVSPYPNVHLAFPGRHQNDTDPKGGDFVVMVDDVNKGWVKHQFTHGDLWYDLQQKLVRSEESTIKLMKDYAKVVRGADPETTGWDFENGLIPEELDEWWDDTLLPQTFLYAVQCLAVAEHRRYWQHECQGGGRYLPARFSIGIIEGFWTADDAKKYQYRGRQGLENLIKQAGRPTPLKKFAES